MAILGVPLGWVMWLIYQIVPNFTIALLLFTLVTKAAMFPFSIKQQKNMAKMASFRPKIERINKMYANNKQKQQEEMMKIYEEEGYNPMGGCLPSLIPLIIMFGLIDVVYKPLTYIARIPAETINKLVEIANKAGGILGQNTYAQEIDIINAVHRDSSLFSAVGSDVLDKVKSIDLNFLGINLGERPTWALTILVLIPIISGITSLLTSLYSMHKSQQVQGKQAGSGMMKGMMIIMPLFSVFFAFQVPAGVGMYWIFSNLFALLQTFLLYKIWSPERVAAREAAAKAAGKFKEKKPSRFQQAMKKAQEQQALQDGTAKPKSEPVSTNPEYEGLSQKEINRRRLAAARKRDAEKYGEEYVEVTDDDLK